MIDTDVGAVWQLWAIFALLAAAGVLLTLRAYRAYRLRPSRPLLYLGAGVGLVTLGMPVAWTSSYLLTGDMFVCTLASSGAILAGAVALVASVQVRSG